MKKLYFDITSGISGDMALSALAGLYPDGLSKFEKVISSVVGSDVKLSITEVYRSGILCNQLVIECDCSNAPFRHYSDIANMINNANLDDKVKQKSIEAFRVIADAESVAHGIPVEEVHFHEVGAVDTLIDIIGVAWFINELGINEVVAYEAVCGTGTINIAHGIVPLPVPAVVKILKNVPFKQIDVKGELTTPTGAAILKAFVTTFGERISGNIIRDSFSTGTKEYDGATNMLRAVIYSTDNNSNKDNVLVLQTNIDDMTGEAMATLLDKLLQNGALDVSYSPIVMKKNRPAYSLVVMSPLSIENTITKTIFQHSSASGVRRSIVERTIMNRDFREVKVNNEVIRIKRFTYEDIEKFSAEWDDCITVAEKLGTTPIDIYEKAVSIAKEL